MSVESVIDLWKTALKGNLAVFNDICAPDCQVWHSSDDKWMSARAAVDNVRERVGELPPFSDVRIQKTEQGFIAQGNIDIAPVGRTHIVQVVTVKDGKAVAIEEYISPEMALAPESA